MLAGASKGSLSRSAAALGSDDWRACRAQNVPWMGGYRDERYSRSRNRNRKSGKFELLESVDYWADF